MIATVLLFCYGNAALIVGETAVEINNLNKHKHMFQEQLCQEARMHIIFSQEPVLTS